MRIKLHSWYEHFPNHKAIDGEPYVDVYNDTFSYEAPNGAIILLIEPRSIQPRIYEWIEQNYRSFKYIFTHDSKLLNLCDNAKLILWGGGCGGISPYPIIEKTKPISTNTAMYINNEMANARNRLSESIRDLLSLKLTFPLGNPLFKKLHTNMFLYTELPNEFVLENFPTIAEVLNSTYNRYVGYSLNRWYIENVTITNDSSRFDVEVEVNPFPSPIKQYRESRIKLEDDYKSAVESKNNKNNEKTKKTKVKTSSSKNTTLKGGEGKLIDNLVKKIVGNETNELKKAKLIHEWLKMNVRYSEYSCSKYHSAEKCYHNRRHLNCADTARLTRAMMASAGLKCYVVHRTYNGGHFWTIIEIDGKKYASDQTGSGSNFNTVWARSGRVHVSNGGSYSRRNGKVPDC